MKLKRYINAAPSGGLEKMEGVYMQDSSIGAFAFLQSHEEGHKNNICLHKSNSNPHGKLLLLFDVIHVC